MLKDKVCIVTGAASGIGLAVAKSFSKDGAKVVMADINEEKLKNESEKIGVDYFKTDLSTREGCKRLVDYTLNKYSKVDVLVNNAGIQHVSPIEDFPEDKWDFMISLMLTAPFLLTKYVWPSMKEQNWGRIININSMHGLRASEFKSAYVSAKHGVSGLTKTAALEGGPYGITVNSICPAYVKTPLVDNQIDDQAKTHGISREKVVEEIMLRKAVVKKLIEPSKIADLVKFLCTDAGDHITGSMMTMDGGWTAN
ncbi:3-hydroxybutyrate dehydrogenase [Anaerosalibacter bizertensis]|uniref:3-hydroxybutyrate dehydrogenase n=1 Tax=Anaerosalibacter bizertensis TaxID=932217 RepID=A0A844FHH1_9FIRM|nr:3-hydroxybutyrate dehydrogenase [Anaerosalibacter bizertensis]MBU5294313.1 3-hydroxybutyrate dehydrogenase [Anaerosalibacter bizertensis]MSS43411.1 3-hydroxybutyrate dehydrogenase [Anaerosalibacter bizertensis]